MKPKLIIFSSLVDFCLNSQSNTTRHQTILHNSHSFFHMGDFMFDKMSSNDQLCYYQSLTFQILIRLSHNKIFYKCIITSFENKCRGYLSLHLYEMYD